MSEVIAIGFGPFFSLMYLLVVYLNPILSIGTCLSLAAGIVGVGERT